MQGRRPDEPEIVADPLRAAGRDVLHGPAQNDRPLFAAAAHRTLVAARGAPGSGPSATRAADRDRARPGTRDRSRAGARDAGAAVRPGGRDDSPRGVTSGASAPRPCLAWVFSATFPVRPGVRRDAPSCGNWAGRAVRPALSRALQTAAANGHAPVRRASELVRPRGGASSSCGRGRREHERRPVARACNPDRLSSRRQFRATSATKSMRRRAGASHRTGRTMRSTRVESNEMDHDWPPIPAGFTGPDSNPSARAAAGCPRRSVAAPSRAAPFG